MAKIRLKPNAYGRDYAKVEIGTSEVLTVTLQEYKYIDDENAKIIQKEQPELYEVIFDNEKNVKVEEPKQPVVVKPTSDEIYAWNKSKQIRELEVLGLNSNQINKLKYEKDRVDKILELQKGE